MISRTCLLVDRRMLLVLLSMASRFQVFLWILVPIPLNVDTAFSHFDILAACARCLECLTHCSPVRSLLAFAVAIAILETHGNTKHSGTETFSCTKDTRQASLQFTVHKVHRTSFTSPHFHIQFRDIQSHIFSIQSPINTDPPKNTSSQSNR